MFVMFGSIIRVVALSCLTGVWAHHLSTSRNRQQEKQPPVCSAESRVKRARISDVESTGKDKCGTLLRKEELRRRNESPMLSPRAPSPTPSSSSSLSACTTSSNFSWSSSFSSSSRSSALSSSKGSGQADRRGRRQERERRECYNSISKIRHQSRERRTNIGRRSRKRECSREYDYPGPQKRLVPPTRTLKMEFWVRTEACKKIKTKHLEYLDRYYYSREQFIEDTVFTCPMTGEQRDVVLEPNMFPYDTPQDIEHWTLWSRNDLSEPELMKFVEGWVVKNRPQVVEWDYDDNAGDRSINWYHVHVFFRLDHTKNGFKRVHDAGSKYNTDTPGLDMVGKVKGLQYCKGGEDRTLSNDRRAG
ncbi:unnamed protein product [Choristocarpus tenellus]